MLLSKHNHNKKGETLNNSAPAANNEWEKAMEETRIEDVNKAWEMANASKDKVESAISERDRMKEGLEMSDAERAQKFGPEFGDIDKFAEKASDLVNGEMDAAERLAEEAGHKYDVKKNTLEQMNNRINGMPEQRTEAESQPDPVGEFRPQQEGLDDFLDELEKS